MLRRRSSMRASASARKLRWTSSSDLSGRPRAGKQLGKLVLLGGNLYQQALAQVAGAHAGRVKMLYQVDAAAQQFKRRWLSGLPGIRVPQGIC